MTPEEKKPDESKKETSKQEIPRVKPGQLQVIPMMEPPEKAKK